MMTYESITKCRRERLQRNGSSGNGETESDQLISSSSSSSLDKEEKPTDQVQVIFNYPWGKMSPCKSDILGFLVVSF